jgi:hypothetical protein
MRSALAVLAASIVGVVCVASSAAFAGDHYDKEATEVVLNRATRQVKENCGHAKDEDGKSVGPWGKPSLSITLGHNGHTKNVSIPEPFDGAPTGKCAVKAFSNLTFPPWTGPDEVLEWPIEIPKPK